MALNANKIKDYYYYKNICIKFYTNSKKKKQWIFYDTKEIY